MSQFYLVIASPADKPLYELYFQTTSRDALPSKRTSTGHLNQFIAHATLDIVDDLLLSSSSSGGYLRVVDKFNDWLVSAFVTPGNARFLLLHENRMEDSIKAFFGDCHELYVRAILNPFYKPDTPITSNGFDLRIRQLVKKHL